MIIIGVISSSKITVHLNCSSLSLLLIWWSCYRKDAFHCTFDWFFLEIVVAIQFIPSEKHQNIFLWLFFLLFRKSEKSVGKNHYCLNHQNVAHFPFLAAAVKCSLFAHRVKRPLKFFEMMSILSVAIHVTA